MRLGLRAPATTAVIAVLLLGACWIGSAMARPGLSGPMPLLEKAILARAAALLERYGTTFHALGRGIDGDGAVIEITPRLSAPLAPDMVAASLREALHAPTMADLAVAAIATDLSEERRVHVVFDARAGDCVEGFYDYGFTAQGTVRFEGGGNFETCSPSARLFSPLIFQLGHPVVFRALRGDLDSLTCPCTFNAVLSEGEDGSYGSGARSLVIAHNERPPFALVDLGHGPVMLAAIEPLSYICASGERSRSSWLQGELSIEVHLRVVGQGAESCWFDGRMTARNPVGESVQAVRGACGC